MLHSTIQSPSEVTHRGWLTSTPSIHYYLLCSDSLAAHSCVNEPACQSAKAGGKWNKRPSLCTLLRSTRPPTRPEISRPGLLLSLRSAAIRPRLSGFAGVVACAGGGRGLITACYRVSCTTARTSVLAQPQLQVQQEAQWEWEPYGSGKLYLFCIV